MSNTHSGNDVTRVSLVLQHTCDGPVDRFVVMSRALDLAAKRTYPADLLADALFEALEDLGGERRHSSEYPYNGNPD